MRKFVTFVALVAVIGMAASAEAQGRNNGRSPNRSGNSSGNKSQFLDGLIGKFIGGKQESNKVYVVSEIQPFTSEVVETRTFTSRSQALDFNTRILNKYWVMVESLGNRSYTPFPSYGEAANYRKQFQVLFGPTNDMRQGRSSGIQEKPADAVGTFSQSNGKGSPSRGLPRGRTSGRSGR
jgi:hypothetical protein